MTNFDQLLNNPTFNCFLFLAMLVVFAWPFIRAKYGSRKPRYTQRNRMVERSYGPPSIRPRHEIVNKWLRDDGSGWRKVEGNWWERDIRVIPPPPEEAHLWEEHAPGRWHKKWGGHK